MLAAEHGPDALARCTRVLVLWYRSDVVERLQCDERDGDHIGPHHAELKTLGKLSNAYVSWPEEPR